jgi:hypothetical protein
MNLKSTRLRGRTRNRRKDEVRGDGRTVGWEEWQEKYITERNGRSSWERQGIVAFCTQQCNEWMNGSENVHVISCTSVSSHDNKSVTKAEHVITDGQYKKISLSQ